MSTAIVSAFVGHPAASFCSALIAGAQVLSYQKPVFWKVLLQSSISVESV